MGYRRASSSCGALADDRDHGELASGEAQAERTQTCRTIRGVRVGSGSVTRVREGCSERVCAPRTRAERTRTPSTFLGVGSALSAKTTLRGA